MAEPPKPHGPKQWSREDLELAEERGDYQLIERARREGNLDQIMNNAEDLDPRSKPMEMRDQ